MSKINKSLICLLMMVKNEEKRITVSFDSVKDFVDTFIILDTGSTDNTIPIMKEYCKNNLFIEKIMYHYEYKSNK